VVVLPTLISSRLGYLESKKAAGLFNSLGSEPPHGSESSAELRERRTRHGFQLQQLPIIQGIHISYQPTVSLCICITVSVDYWPRFISSKPLAFSWDFFKIILGSSSPARRAILSDMGYEFATMSADIDERAIRREKPEELVKALAEAKADAIKLNLVDGCADRDIRDPPTLLITSDQVVVSKGVIRERPRSMEEAREFIKGNERAFSSSPCVYMRVMKCDVHIYG
uniref:Maf-like protein n=1 Tax=Aegilops tauschii subsp. strangulata TaxID=200361 RepID=A0A453H9F8_AEGTS